MAEKQMHRSIEQKGEPQNGPSTLGLTNQERISNGKNDCLFIKWCWENWTATRRRMKLDHFLTPHTKINSKWMKDLNVRQDSIKILEENTGSNLCDLSCSNFLLDTSPTARETEAKMNYWDFIMIKTFA